VIGQGVSNHGYSMLDDLVGKAGYFQVLVLNVIGKLPEKRLTDWMESAFICMSWPDARIWCNQIGALAGDARVSPVAAVCAGTLAGDSKMYGPGTVLAAVDFIATATREIEAGQSVASFIAARATVKGRMMAPGYGRPIASGDQRVAAMQRVAEQLGFTVGRHLATAFAIESYLLDSMGESLNLAGYMSAFLLDQGFQGFEGYVIFSLCVNGGIHACYAENRAKPAGSFLPMRCADIAYAGFAERAVPDA
jgi:citrate synthase